MPAELLSVENASVRFRSNDGPVHALDSVNLSVSDGEFVCLVGPSGCGKTTLLRLIAGFTAATSGAVRVDGQVVSGPDARRGMVFQQPSLYPWLSVRENVEFGPRMRGVSSGERRHLSEQYLDMVGLSDFSRRAPYELSGGMQQRVAIARVLANDSGILLMDEPFGALDALTRAHLQEELLRIWRRTQKTVVFVTHSVEEAVYLATRVVILTARPGRVAATIDCPFSREDQGGNSRQVKSLPQFVELREKVLDYIWT